MLAPMTALLERLPARNSAEVRPLVPTHSKSFPRPFGIRETLLQRIPNVI